MLTGTNFLANAFPRSYAVAERLWSAQTVRDVPDAKRRLHALRCLLLGRGLMIAPAVQSSVGGVDGSEPWGFCPQEVDTRYTPRGWSLPEPTGKSTNKVAYFSWYSYTGCDEGLLPEPGCQRNLSASPGATLRNLAMDGDLGFLRRTHDQLSVSSLLNLQNSKWHEGVYDYSPAETGLAAGWEQVVDDCIATLVPLARGNGGHIHGVQLGDELVCGSIKHFSFANLSALAGRLHDGLHPHGVFIFTNECAGTPATWPEIPAGLDVRVRARARARA